MEEQKKKRAENWSSEEKVILRQLVAQSAQILEDKSMKASSNLRKVKEWKSVAMKHNELTGKNRTDSELKFAWKRMKLAAKANVSSHRQEVMKTGGGEKPKSPSVEDQAIMAIAPHDFIVEYNHYDSDAVPLLVEIQSSGEEVVAVTPESSTVPVLHAQLSNTLQILDHQDTSDSNKVASATQTQNLKKKNL